MTPEIRAVVRSCIVSRTALAVLFGAVFYLCAKASAPAGAVFAGFCAVLNTAEVVRAARVLRGA